MRSHLLLQLNIFLYCIVEEFDREDTKNVEIMENILRTLSCRDCLISDKYVSLLFSVS